MELTKNKKFHTESRLAFRHLFSFISGYQCFGLQFVGECWSGPKACEMYKKYDQSYNCVLGVGMAMTNAVYMNNNIGEIFIDGFQRINK